MNLALNSGLEIWHLDRQVRLESFSFSRINILSIMSRLSMVFGVQDREIVTRLITLHSGDFNSRKQVR